MGDNSISEMASNIIIFINEDLKNHSQSHVISQKLLRYDWKNIHLDPYYIKRIIIEICNSISNENLSTLFGKNDTLYFIHTCFRVISSWINCSLNRSYGYQVFKSLFILMTKELGSKHINLYNKEYEVIVYFSLSYFESHSHLCQIEAVRKNINDIFWKSNDIVCRLYDDNSKTKNILLKKKYFEFLANICINHDKLVNCDKTCFVKKISHDCLIYFINVDSNEYFTKILSFIIDSSYSLEIFETKYLHILCDYLIEKLNKNDSDFVNKNLMEILLKLSVKLNKVIENSSITDLQHEYTQMKFFNTQIKILDAYRLSGIKLDENFQNIINNIYESDLCILKKFRCNNIFLAQYLLCLESFIYFSFEHEPDYYHLVDNIIKWIGLYVIICDDDFISKLIENFKIYGILKNYLNVLQNLMQGELLKNLYTKFLQVANIAKFKFIKL